MGSVAWSEAPCNILVLSAHLWCDVSVNQSFSFSLSSLQAFLRVVISAAIIIDGVNWYIFAIVVISALSAIILTLYLRASHISFAT